jgi:hypothetical protein
MQLRDWAINSRNIYVHRRQQRTLKKKNIKIERKGTLLFPVPDSTLRKRGIAASSFSVYQGTHQNKSRNKDRCELARNRTATRRGKRLQGEERLPGRRLLAAPRESGSGIGDVSSARSPPGVQNRSTRERKRCEIWPAFGRGESAGDYSSRPDEPSSRRNWWEREG